MCFVLVYALLIQIKTIEESDSEALKAYSEDELKTKVLEWKEKYNDVKKELDENEKILEEYRNAATQENESTKVMQKELDKANALIGLKDVKGKGIIMKIDDTVESVFGEPVSYEELLKIVNELKAAGAEAISVNGHRVINTTEIRYISSTTIVINNEYITSPYEIRAIGNIDNLESAMKFKGGVVENLKKEGIEVSIDTSNEVKINKYDGIIKNEYAQVENK